MARNTDPLVLVLGRAIQRLWCRLTRHRLVPAPVFDDGGSATQGWRCVDCGQRKIAARDEEIILYPDDEVQ